MSAREHNPVGHPTHDDERPKYTQGTCTCGWKTRRIEGIGQWPSAVSWQEFQRHQEESGVIVPQEEKDNARMSQLVMELGYLTPRLSVFDRVVGWLFNWTDLLTRLRTANAIEARAIWKEARERGVTDALERAYRFGGRDQRKQIDK